jgi:hypothetical protein
MNGLRLTIDIDGLSMVLENVNGGSQKGQNAKKKHDWFNKNTGLNKHQTD